MDLSMRVPVVRNQSLFFGPIFVFWAMSRRHRLLSKLSREQNLVPDMSLILTDTTASGAIVSCILSFIENLLHLDIELDENDDVVRRNTTFRCLSVASLSLSE
ncbi:hypothetical protein CFOL_v3_27840 [Cephalotus follicularis]|uniref:Uncharacterized protein n=1 Tax=Cephalotus follicularis TaxID=3775 RepID=A0A1Q3CVV8_CEPFO|nr:hypothetical protein CFOL_v3_27840 [Cephalotus follicularis]